jgi:glycosyltransferase involved in cell wall biosynthesis
MNSKPKVSVVIASYNMGHFIATAVTSILSQTISDFELLVIDDGSSDDTTARITPYLDDHRVKYQYIEHSGQAIAKNLGITLSEGEFVGFCDADDIWAPDKLEAQLPVFKQDPDIGLVYTRANEIDALGLPLPSQHVSRQIGSVTEALLCENFIPFGSVLVRRSLLTTFGIFRTDLSMSIDLELWLRLSLVCEFALVPTVLYSHRIWDGQLSNNWRGRFDARKKIMVDFIDRNPGVVSTNARYRAWSYFYANRARARALMSQDLFGCIRDAVIAIRYGHAATFAAKSVGRAFIEALR